MSTERERVKLASAIAREATMNLCAGRRCSKYATAAIGTCRRCIHGQTGTDVAHRARAYRAIINTNFANTVAGHKIQRHYARCADSGEQRMLLNYGRKKTSAAAPMEETHVLSTWAQLSVGRGDNQLRQGEYWLFIKHLKVR
jgi:hypothetical protein